MTKILRDTDAGWIAGIIDGEGCIYIAPRGSLRVGVNNCDRRIIDRLLALVGGRDDFPRGRVDPRSSNFSTWYGWSMEGEAAVDILTQIAPLLISKGEQARVAIQFGQTLGQRGRGYPLEPGMWERREELRLQLRALRVRKRVA